MLLQALCNNWWIQTGVTVRKRPILFKIRDFFCPVWPWNLADDLEQGKSQGFDSCDRQGWGQFHFFNSIPNPLFSIPIPILLLTISFNSNSNSGDFNSNSNSNSGNFKSNFNSRNDLLMSSSKLVIMITTMYMYIKLLLPIWALTFASKICPWASKII